jgi:predicted dehydrogenase
VLEPADLGAAKRFARFRAVLASEDNFALPLFVLARRLVDDGAVGRLRRVYLFHSGYRHHALAALRRLTGARPRRVSVDRSSRWSADVHVTFPSGIRATIVEPRRYEIGRTMIVGDAGFLADYPIDHRHATRIGYATVDGRFRGLTLDEDPLPPTELDEAFRAGLEGATLEDDSLMNQMKIRGAMELLVGLGDPGSRERYPAADAIEDNLAMHVAERIRLAPARGSLLRPAARAAASFVRSGGEET